MSVSAPGTFVMSGVMQTYITGPWITDLVISHHRYIISRRNWGLTSDRGLWLILNHFDCERDYLSRAETMQIFMMRYILQILSHWEMPGKEFGRLIEISTGWINQNITWASWGCGSHQSWHLAILDVRWYRNTMMISLPSSHAPHNSPLVHFIHPRTH